MNQEQRELSAQSNQIVGLQGDGMRLVDRDKEIAARRERLIRSKMSLPGMLGLERTLEEARQTYGIPDSAFDQQAVFKSVYVLQVAMQEGETYKDSQIILAESTRDRELRKAPIGVIVSAGLEALDVMRSHGIDLGHKITFVHSAPYFIRFDNIGGVDQHLVVLDVRNIRSSYNLAADLKARRQNIKQVSDDDGLIRHVLVNEDRVVTTPVKVED
jgi:hypothetical protein